MADNTKVVKTPLTNVIGGNPTEAGGNNVTRSAQRTGGWDTGNGYGAPPAAFAEGALVTPQAGPQGALDVPVNSDTDAHDAFANGWANDNSNDDTAPQSVNKYSTGAPGERL